MAYIKYAALSLLLLLSVVGCNSDSLQIQRQFPFTLTTTAIPLQINAGEKTVFTISINPDRITTDSQYTVSWKNLTTQEGYMALGSVGPLPENASVASPSLTPTLAFGLPGAAQNSFSVTVTDKFGATQSLTYSVTTK